MHDGRIARDFAAGQDPQDLSGLAIEGQGPVPCKERDVPVGRSLGRIYYEPARCFRPSSFSFGCRL